MASDIILTTHEAGKVFGGLAAVDKVNLTLRRGE